MRDDLWMEKAACRGLPESVIDELFFPEKGHSGVHQLRRARAFCQVCPVRRHCLAFAIAHKVSYGVWGGMSEQQRHALSRSVKMQIRRRWFSKYRGKEVKHGLQSSGSSGGGSSWASGVGT